MVFKVKERYSLHREHADVLLKYDLSSSVGRDPKKLDFWRFTVEPIGNAFHENLRVDCSDLYRLKYVIGVDIKPLKEKMKSLIGFENKICSIKRVEMFAHKFIKQYQERHLKYKEDTASAITNYLSVCEMLNLDNFIRLDVFRFALKILIEADVKDHSVCRKLFLFVKHRELRKILLSTLETGNFLYLLENLCNRHENNEYIWNNIDMIEIINWGHIDNLKVALDYKSCVEFNPEDVQRSFRDFFDVGPSADVSLEEYSSERLMLLLQMAYIMQPESDESDLHDFENLGGSREKAIEAVKLSWKTIPQAYFTWQEMKDVLDRLFIKCLPSDLDLFDKNEIEGKIQGAIEEYKRTFNVPVKKPRSLKNYARIAVRKRCRTAGAVDELVSAKRLRAYVKLQ